ncbi:hypothetical protein ACJX0J_025225, partial [Zea mays]
QQQDGVERHFNLDEHDAHHYGHALLRDQIKTKCSHLLNNPKIIIIETLSDSSVIMFILIRDKTYDTRHLLVLIKRSEILANTNFPQDLQNVICELKEISVSIYMLE